MGTPIRISTHSVSWAQPEHKGSIAVNNNHITSSMSDAINDAELQEAFKLFDMDGDGMITVEELKKLVEKIGGSMTDGEAKALIHQADKDGNEGIDFSEFSKLWSAIKGEGEEELEIKKEFLKLDTDSSGFITKEEMMSIITDCDHFTGDKMEEAKKCVAELDVDQDGRVSYPEFLLVWK